MGGPVKPHIIGASRDRIGFDRVPNVQVAQDRRRDDAAVYPELVSCRVVRVWTGFRPWTPDKQSMVGLLEPGLVPRQVESDR